VALFMENRPEFIITWLGLTKAGVVIALINSNNKMKPLLHAINIAHCVAVIFGTELTPNVAGVLPELNAAGIPLYGVAGGEGEPGTEVCPDFAADVLAQLNAQPTTKCPAARRASIKGDDDFGYIYTSGTTGLPKVGGLFVVGWNVGTRM
jgi:acyl-CoA synthetase (AMP-forming)/AMP-acid ligase II